MAVILPIFVFFVISTCFWSPFLQYPLIKTLVSKFRKTESIKRQIEEISMIRRGNDSGFEIQNHTSEESLLLWPVNLTPQQRPKIYW